MREKIREKVYTETKKKNMSDESVREEKEKTNLFHKRLSLKNEKASLCMIFRRHRLNRMECEIVLALLLYPLGLWNERIMDVGDVVKILGLSASKTIEALRCISEDGRLFRNSLIHYDDPDEELTRIMHKKSGAMM